MSCRMASTGNPDSAIHRTLLQRLHVEVIGNSRRKSNGLINRRVCACGRPSQLCNPSQGL